MKVLSSKKFFRALFVITSLIAFLIAGLFVSMNFIVDPVIYWLASTERARIFIGCILSWLGVSALFNLFYKYYRSRKKIERFNALNVPYARTFKGRKR
tara:strand:- start:29 stop:322 length:294 start_codon:yes stop_codon:yes gene_type:complete